MAGIRPSTSLSTAFRASYPTKRKPTPSSSTPEPPSPVSPYPTSVPIDPTSNGNFVDAGQSCTEFAFACNATVYDVQLTMFNGSVTAFNTTPSDLRKADIIQAPLQIGVGQFRLHQAATTATVANLPFSQNMAQFFSRVGMAAASGAFYYAKNEQHRFHDDVMVMQVPLDPFWFPVGSYSACGLAILGAAFWLRRDEGTGRRQSDLIWNPESKRSLERVKLTLRHPRAA